MGSIAFRVLDEIWISIIQPEVVKAHVGLFPLDHAVSVVSNDDDGDVNAKSHSRFEFLGVHHEAAVAANGCHRLLRMNQFGCNRRRQSGAHRRQRIV